MANSSCPRPCPMTCFTRLLSASLLLLSCSVYASTIHLPNEPRKPNDSKVLILGGGVTGIIAARTLHENGINDFVIIEARDELGGRLKSTSFAGLTVELGANWVQGTQTGNGPANPIFSLVQKHGVKTQLNDYYSSMSKKLHSVIKWINAYCLDFKRPTMQLAPLTT